MVPWLHRPGLEQTLRGLRIAGAAIADRAAIKVAECGYCKLLLVHPAARSSLKCSSGLFDAVACHQRMLWNPDPMTVVATHDTFLSFCRS